MKTQLPYILFALLLISCGGNRNTGAEVETELVAETDFFVFDLEAGIEQGPKATMLNELIDSISYIPLETHSDALLPERYVFAKIGSDVFISGGTGQMSPIYKFDSLGRFVKQMNFYGRGPNEISMLMRWYANISLKQINIVGTGSKMVIVQTEGGEKSAIQINQRQGFDLIPLNDSTFVSSQNLYYRDISKTYLYFTDRAGNLLNSIGRNDDKLEYNTGDIPEGAWTGPYESYWLAPDYEGDAIFHNIFNDTLYRIKSHSEITPHLVFKRGELLPDPKDTYKPENKKKQIYFTHIKESGDYVFLNYYYGGKLWRDMWSKRDGSLKIHTAPEKFGSIEDVFLPFALPDGEVIDLQVVYAEKDKIYCILRTFDACQFLPGIKEDDNPVIVVAKLKK